MLLESGLYTKPMLGNRGKEWANCCPQHTIYACTRGHKPPEQKGAVVQTLCNRGNQNTALIFLKDASIAAFASSSHLESFWLFLVGFILRLKGCCLIKAGSQQVLSM